jgi:hypothetical protein
MRIVIRLFVLTAQPLQKYDGHPFAILENSFCGVFSALERSRCKYENLMGPFTTIILVGKLLQVRFLTRIIVVFTLYLTPGKLTS